MKRAGIILLVLVCTMGLFSCRKDTSQTDKLLHEIERINGETPDHTFLYLYKDGISYYCYSRNGEKRSGTMDIYYEYPLQILNETDHDSSNIINQDEISQEQIVIYDYVKGFITYATNGSKQFKRKQLFANPLPRYTQNAGKCQEISLKNNSAGYPTNGDSCAYFTIDNLDCTLFYYGQDDTEEVKVLVVIGCDKFVKGETQETCQD